MTFTEKLDLLMEEKHLNKNSLSKACGIPYTTIDGWYKKGVSDLKLSTLRKLTNYFGLSLDYWLKDEEDAETKKSPAPEGTEDEKAVVSLEQSTRFLVAMGLIREGEQLSDRDVEFLEHLVGLLRAWFAEHKAKNR